MGRREVRPIDRSDGSTDRFKGIRWPIDQLSVCSGVVEAAKRRRRPVGRCHPRDRVTVPGEERIRMTYGPRARVFRMFKKTYEFRALSGGRSVQPFSQGALLEAGNASQIHRTYVFGDIN